MDSSFAQIKGSWRNPSKLQILYYNTSEDYRILHLPCFLPPIRKGYSTVLWFAYMNAYIQYTQMCAWLKSSMHQRACHDCVCKCKRSGGRRFASLLTPPADFVQNSKQGRVGGGGPRARFLNGQPSEQMPDTLMRTTCKRWNHISPPQLPQMHRHTYTNRHLLMHAQLLRYCIPWKLQEKYWTS